LLLGSISPGVYSDTRISNDDIEFYESRNPVSRLEFILTRMRTISRLRQSIGRNPVSRLEFILTNDVHEATNHYA